MISKITQSFIKAMRSYVAGTECGHIIKAQFVDDRLLDDPDREPGVLELGCYFEWLLTKALPKDGKQPVPQYMVKPLKDNGGKTDGLTVKDMIVSYRNAHANVEAVRLLLMSYELTIIEFGKKITKGRFAGTLDLIVRAESDREFAAVSWKKGDFLVIDLKYSGLVGMDNRMHWKNKSGWQWSPIQKQFHGTQSVQYHYLTGWPFFFLVCQSNNTEGTAPLIEFFHVPVTAPMLEAHLVEGNHMMDKLKLEQLMGFEARPVFAKCEKCPLKGECKDRQTYPLPKIVDLTLDWNEKY